MEETHFNWAGLLCDTNQQTAQDLAAGRIKLGWLGQIPSPSENRCFI